MGRQATKILLSASRDNETDFDAVFCGSDQIARGVWPTRYGRQATASPTWHWPASTTGTWSRHSVQGPGQAKKTMIAAKNTRSFEAVPLVKALWWHPVYDQDIEHLWLRQRFAEAIAEQGLTPPIPELTGAAPS
jgi:hypothetical protein